jgi:quercetin dioxygenase-like cupin family protein
MADSKARAFVVQPGHGTRVRTPAGGPSMLKAHAGNTGGVFTLMENEIPPGTGPRFHRHAAEEEMWYVLTGRFRFRIDEEIVPAPAGTFVFVPRGIAHCFQNVSDRSARILVMFAPSGIEGLFMKLAQLPAGPIDAQVHSAVAQEYGMEIIGPPLADSHPAGQRRA